MLKELNVVKAHVLVLFIDNINVKYLTANLIMHAMMKYMEIDFHFIVDLVVENKLDVKFIPSRSI